MRPSRQCMTHAFYTPRRLGEVQGYLQISDAKHFRARYLQPLLASGWLEMTEPNRPNSPTQKYRTTEVGRAVLAAATSSDET